MSHEACSCTGNSLDRFVRPSVMAVLARHPEGLHGYLVAQHLQEMTAFGDCPPDPAGLYRVLKTMEVEGYLRSSWDMEGSGPARRVYALTNEGWDCLHHWAGTLRAYARTLQETLCYVEQSLQPAGVSIPNS